MPTTKLQTQVCESQQEDGSLWRCPHTKIILTIPISQSDFSTAVKEAARSSVKNSNRRRSASRRSPSSRLTQRKPQISSVQPQTDDEETAHSYREVLDEARADGAVAIVPRRLRQGHRAFRMTWTAGFVLSVLFAQLLSVLWLKAAVTSAAHRNDKLRPRNPRRRIEHR